VDPQEEQPADEQEAHDDPPANRDGRSLDLLAPHAGHSCGFLRAAKDSSSSKRPPQARHSYS
jgi:hypothetical protein